MKRFKLLINRFFCARRFSLFFFGVKYFKIPKNLSLNGENISLDLPTEYGIKNSFIEIFLDDAYQLAFIKKLAKQNEIEINSILDIGGNCGLTSLLSRYYFPKSVINCYEPNPYLRNYLLNNSKVGNFDFFTEAVGYKSSMVHLNIDEEESILSTISTNKIGITKQISFKKAVDRFKFDNIDIVKMDCEGSEWEILRDLNSWKKVKFLTMEYHLDKNNLNHFKIVNFLDKIGFRLISKIDQSKNVDYGMALAYNSSILSL